MKNVNKFCCLVCLAFLVLSCKKENTENEASSNNIPDSLAIAQPSKKGLDYNLPDALLSQKIVADQLKFRYSYSSLKKLDTVWVDIIHPADSSFKVINILGRVREKTTVYPFSENKIIRGGKELKNSVGNYIFKVDKNTGGHYTLYTASLAKPSDGISVLDATFRRDSIVATEKEPDANYFISLLSKSKIHFTEPVSQKFFKIRKKDRFVPDSIAAQDIAYYRWNSGFFKIPVLPAIQPCYVSYGDTLAFKKLYVKISDSSAQMIPLAGSGKNFRAFSEFNNDSLMTYTAVKESLLKDSKHLVVYGYDSLVTTYHYSKEPIFRELKTDTFTYKKRYPQYYRELKGTEFYVESSPFTMNKVNAVWRYKVAYEDTITADSKNILVKVMEKQLLQEKTGNVLFNYPIGKANIIHTDIRFLDESDSDIQQTDINSDGFTDLIFSRGKSADQNEQFDVYAYNPANRSYEFAKPFSGTSITGSLQVDSKKQMAVYSRNNGNNQYSITRLHFSKGKIISKEIFWNGITTKNDSTSFYINYQKIVGSEVVDKNRNDIQESDWTLENLRQKFLEWVALKTE